MARNITVTFDDGTTHLYNNVPDTVTPEAIQQRASTDFGRVVSGIDGGRAAAPEAVSIPAETITPPEAESTIMEKVIGAVKGAANEVTQPLPDNKMLSKEYLTENIPRSIARLPAAAAYGAGKMLYDAAKTFTDPVVSVASGGDLGQAASDFIHAPSRASRNLATQLGESIAAPLGFMGREAASQAWNDPAASLASITPLKHVAGQVVKPVLTRRANAMAMKLMEMTLRQPSGVGIEQIQNNVKTVLDNQIPINLKGMDKLEGKMALEINKIGKGIHDGKMQGVTGNFNHTKGLIEALRDEANRSDMFKKNNAILDNQLERLDNHPAADIISGEIPIQELQRMKIEQMQNVQKDYGAHTPQFQKEVDKARIRGFKEELEAKLDPIFPELSESNAQLGKYFELQKVLERAVADRSKASLVSAGMLMKPGVGSVIGAPFGPVGSAIGGGLGTALSIIEHPSTAPKVAQFLYNKARPNLAVEHAKLLRAQILEGLGTTATNADNQ